MSYSVAFPFQTLKFIADWRRKRKRLPQPWEYVPADWHSEELRKAHAQELVAAWLEANPDANPEKTRRQAEAIAAMFDARTRNWACHEKKTVGEYYEKQKPQYLSYLDDDYWRDALPEEMRLGGG